MNKVLRLVVHNRKTIIKTLIIGAVAIGAYMVAHKLGTAERGYEAIGGELFIPFLIIFAEDIWGAIKEPFKVVGKH
jgi:hypothetical protein